MRCSVGARTPAARRHRRRRRRLRRRQGRRRRRPAAAAAAAALAAAAATTALAAATVAAAAAVAVATATTTAAALAASAAALAAAAAAAVARPSVAAVAAAPAAAAAASTAAAAIAVAATAAATTALAAAAARVAQSIPRNGWNPLGTVSQEQLTYGAALVLAAGCCLLYYIYCGCPKCSSSSKPGPPRPDPGAARRSSAARPPRANRGRDPRDIAADEQLWPAQQAAASRDASPYTYASPPRVASACDDPLHRGRVIDLERGFNPVSDTKPLLPRCAGRSDDADAAGAGWLTRSDAGGEYTVGGYTYGRRPSNSGPPAPAPPPPIQLDAARTPEESLRTATVLGSSELPKASFTPLGAVGPKEWARYGGGSASGGAAAASAAATAASVVAAEASPAAARAAAKAASVVSAETSPSKEHRLVGRVHAYDQPPEWFEVLPPEGIKNHPAVDATAAAQSAARAKAAASIYATSADVATSKARDAAFLANAHASASPAAPPVCIAPPPAFRRDAERDWATAGGAGPPRWQPAGASGFAEPVRDAAPRPPRCNRTSPRRARGDTSYSSPALRRADLSPHKASREMGKPAGANTSFPATSFPIGESNLPSGPIGAAARVYSLPDHAGGVAQLDTPVRRRVRRPAQQLAQLGGLRVA